MAEQWAAEASDRRYDIESGALITQLTSSAASSINIYCEQPYTSPDGNRVAILRRNDISFDTSWRLIVADLTTLKLALVERDGVTGACNAAWSGLLHYTTEDGSMRRVNLETLEKDDVALPAGTTLQGRGASVSPDQAKILYSRVVDGPEMAVVVVDLKAGKERVIFQDPELANPHLQFNPVHGETILVQHNRGSKLAPDGTIERIVGEQGTTHFVMASDGSKRTPLPAGPPHTPPSTGHSNFVADTGRVAWAAHWNQQEWTLDGDGATGNFFTALPGDAEATPFPAPQHRFNHVNVSRCGRYFVCDSVPGSMYDEQGILRNPCLVIGNLQTNKYRTLVHDTGGCAGGGQHQHPHAYITADNRNVIYNAQPGDSPTQVYAARVPEGFLESLD